MLLILAFYLLGYYTKPTETKIQRIETIIYRDSLIFVNVFDTLKITQKGKLKIDTLYLDKEKIVKYYSDLDTILNSNFATIVNDSAYYTNLRTELNIRYDLKDSIFNVNIYNLVDTNKIYYDRIEKIIHMECQKKWYNEEWFLWGSRAIFFVGGVYVGSQITK